MGDTVNNEHDVGYKYLLSAKQVFVQLLRTFVKKGWVTEVEEENAKLINKSFVLPDFQEKEADIVYEIKVKDQEVIFYILTELQSTVDYQMPYRLLLYMIEIWREVIKSSDKKEVTRKIFRLPVIIPIVLYNGKDNWTTPLEFKQMLNQSNLFGDNVLNYKYIILDVERYKEKDLLEISNLISSIFYLDRETKDTQEIVDRLQQLTDTLHQLSSKEFELFLNWFKRIVMRRFPNKQQEEMEKILNQTNPKEAKEMISPLGESLQRHLDELERKRKEAKQEGIQKGEKDNAIKVAMRLLGKGMSIAEIAEITELSINEIRNLQN